MYLQELIEVAIGLIFAWLLLSIAVLQVQEIIAAWTGKRSKDLYGAIEKMLNDPNMLEDFYRHPLIESLKTPPSWLKQKFSKTGTKPQKPSYIPAETFARVLFDVVTKAGTKESLLTITFTAFKHDIKKLKEGDQKIAIDLLSYVVDLAQIYAGTHLEQFKAEVKKEILIKLTELEKAGADNTGHYPLAKVAAELRAYVNGNRTDELATLFRTTEPYLNQVRKGLLINGSKELGEALHSLLVGVEEYATNTDKAIAIGRKNVETWFDNSMERLSGWYKRWAQTWSFFIALAIAIAFNIDSIHIANTLWKTPELRAATASYIQGYVEQETKKDGFDINKVNLQPISDHLQQISYPVGWPGDVPQQFAGWLIKIIGFLITAGAAMQGAPFWFDTLKKLVNIRSTGANPAEKPKESTSDKER